MFQIVNIKKRLLVHVLSNNEDMNTPPQYKTLKEDFFTFLKKLQAKQMIHERLY